MRQVLTLHPQSQCLAAASIAVEVARPRPEALVLRYRVAGAMRDLRLPAAAAPARADELWRHTCFEAFLRAPPRAAYYELNVAPSLQWAAYRFDAYRHGMRVASEIATPRLDARSDDDAYALDVALALEGVPDLPGDAPWRLGLSAVIEETGGRMSYWALAHPAGKPDFHHADGFACLLGAA